MGPRARAAVRTYAICATECTARAGRGPCAVRAPCRRPAGPFPWCAQRTLRGVQRAKAERMPSLAYGMAGRADQVTSAIRQAHCTGCCTVQAAEEGKRPILPQAPASSLDGHSMHIGPMRPVRKSFRIVVEARSMSPVNRSSASRCR